MILIVRFLLSIVLVVSLVAGLLRAVRGRYWNVFAPARLRVAAVTAVLAAALGLAGGYLLHPYLLWVLDVGIRPPLEVWYTWVPASIATWLILVPLLPGASRLKVAGIGVVSVAIGTMLWNVGPVLIGYATGELGLHELLGGVLAFPLWAVTFGGLTLPISVPIGIGAAFLIRAATSRWADSEPVGEAVAGSASG